MYGEGAIEEIQTPVDMGSGLVSPSKTTMHSTTPVSPSHSFATSPSLLLLRLRCCAKLTEARSNVSAKDAYSPQLFLARCGAPNHGTQRCELVSNKRACQTRLRACAACVCSRGASGGLDSVRRIGDRKGHLTVSGVCGRGRRQCCTQPEIDSSWWRRWNGKHGIEKGHSVV